MTLSIIAGEVTTSSSNVAAENDASVVSRTARTVADRRRPVEQAQFAHHLATTEFGDETFVAVVDDVHRHTTADDEVGGVGDVALVEQHLAGLERRQPTPVDDLLHDRLVGAAHQLGDHRGHVGAVDPLAGLVRDSVGHLGMAVQPVLELGPLDLDTSTGPLRGERAPCATHRRRR